MDGDKETCYRFLTAKHKLMLASDELLHDHKTCMQIHWALPYQQKRGRVLICSVTTMAVTHVVFDLDGLLLGKAKA